MAARRSTLHPGVHAGLDRDPSFLAAPPIAAVHLEPNGDEVAGLDPPPPSSRSAEPGERKVVVLEVEAHPSAVTIPFLAAEPSAAVHLEPHLDELAGLEPLPSSRSAEPGGGEGGRARGRGASFGSRRTRRR